MNRLLLVGLVLIAACKDNRKDSDRQQREAQEKILEEGNAQVGLPAITNFRERKTLKDILELRDQADYVTYTYLYSDYSGKLVFFCNSIGYPIPAATEFTNPMKPSYSQYGNFSLPQADPNGLFSPASAEGTWVQCKDPNGPDVKVVYAEPRIIVSPFRLEEVKAEAPPSK